MGTTDIVDELRHAVAEAEAGPTDVRWRAAKEIVGLRKSLNKANADLAAAKLATSDAQSKLKQARAYKSR